MKIKCSTLFDITKTDVSNRRQVMDGPNQLLATKQRSQQSNFETVLQIISMRSQPEDISTPIKHNVKVDQTSIWGSRYIKSLCPCWTFTFTVQHSSVFNDGNDELGNLLTDCENVPMIVSLEESESLNNILSITGHSKNIHFEIDNT